MKNIVAVTDFQKGLDLAVRKPDRIGFFEPEIDIHRIFERMGLRDQDIAVNPQGPLGPREIPGIPACASGAMEYSELQEFS